MIWLGHHGNGVAVEHGELFPVNGREYGKGILPSQDIEQFISGGVIRATAAFGVDQIQPASIDLRLGREAYCVRASFLPGESSTILTKATAADLLLDRLDLTEGAILKENSVYIIKLMESLALPPDVHGIANPKSTTGRLDILTRLITECGEEFERVRKGYQGDLYIEVVTRTFPIIVRQGLKLNQLRFVRGSAMPATDYRLKALAKAEFRIGDDEADRASINRGWPITVDLEGNGHQTPVAYKAKKHQPPIDFAKVGVYEIADFWDAIPKPSTGRIVLEPDSFYILVSKRAVRVKPTQAAEMIPYDPTMGEFRVHYAGFFDPGFGYGRKGEIEGTKAVLEVRAHDIPILLEDDQLVGRLAYYEMASEPAKVYGVSIGSSYQEQGLALSKQFKRPPRAESTLNSLPTAPPTVLVG
ncbi:MAG: 2'-deoxycytidine 5'-triphosphate deaminase [Candidatus Acidiferrales bacterium]